MAIVNVYNKDRDVTYVYDSYSYWDKEKKQPRSKRKLIGKLDPVTGEIVPTGKRGRPRSTPANSDTNQSALYEQSLHTISARDAEISDLKREMTVLQKENQRLHKIIDQISSLTAGAR